MQNPALTVFLTGKYNRQSLRDILEGLTVSDLVGIGGVEFISCLNQKDRIIGLRLWEEVLNPVRAAWVACKVHSEPYLAAKKELDDLLQKLLPTPAVTGQN
jgi:hypothetical protein